MGNHQAKVRGCHLVIEILLGLNELTYYLSMLIAFNLYSLVSIKRPKVVALVRIMGMV
jgi:hypothetical protein